MRSCRAFKYFPSKSSFHNCPSNFLTDCNPMNFPGESFSSSFQWFVWLVPRKLRRKNASLLSATTTNAVILLLLLLKHLIKAVRASKLCTAVFGFDSKYITVSSILTNMVGYTSRCKLLGENIFINVFKNSCLKDFKWPLSFFPVLFAVLHDSFHLFRKGYTQNTIFSGSSSLKKGFKESALVVIALVETATSTYLCSMI